MSDMSSMMSLLAGGGGSASGKGGGSGGMVGTANEPYNPAAKLAGGTSTASAPSKDNASYSQAEATKQAPDVFASILKAVMPQTMGSLGGSNSSGGGYVDHSMANNFGEGSKASSGKGGGIG